MREPTMKTRTRIRLLRVHGVFMLVVGAINAGVSTWGYFSGQGGMGFLHGAPIGHVGLIQAYLLMCVLGLALLLGASSNTPRRFHPLGALAHASVLVAYAIHWDTLASFSASGGTIRNALVVMHLAWLAAETAASVMAVEAPAAVELPRA